MATSAEPGRTSASRLFAVLNAFDRAHPVMTLTELSSSSGLPIATTFRMLRELVTAGAVERNDDGLYQIGLRLWELGALAPRQRELRRVARPIMDNLHEATGETVQFAVLDGSRALCIEKVSSSRSATNVTEIAAGLPLHATGVGKAILAFADPAVLPEKGRRLRRFTPNTIVDQAQVDADILRARTDFVTYCREELTLGTSSVASPVFGADGRFVGAVGLLTRSPASLQRLAPAVRTAALTISQRMGHRAAHWPVASIG